MTMFLCIVAIIMLIKYADVIGKKRDSKFFTGSRLFVKLKAWFFIFKPKKKFEIKLDKADRSATLRVRLVARENEQRVNDSTLALKRAGCYREIEDWVYEMRRSPHRKKTIEEWKFKKGESDVLKVRFRGTDEFVCGKVSFIYDDGFPRVSRFTWKDENGKSQFITGRKIPQIPFSKLVDSFILSKQDTHKLQYINKVAYNAQMQGEAIFEICEYEQIDQNAFKDTFGVREVKALACALKEFRVTRFDAPAGRLFVELPSEPEM